MDDLPEYPLHLLASRASSHAHSQLRSLLKLLPAKDVATRKQLLLQYALHTRHTFARLLTTVRWLQHRQDLVSGALRTEEIALSSVYLFEDIADSLWAANAGLVSASSRKPLVTKAADNLLSSPMPSHTSLATKSDETAPNKSSFLSSEVSEVTLAYPSPNAPSSLKTPAVPSLSHSSHKPSHASQHQSSSLGSSTPPPTERLAIATRNSIRECLLHLGPLQVLAWHSGRADICVKVGLPGLWSADVSLDSLDPESPLLRVHALLLQVSNDSDAPALSSNFPELRPTHVQYAALRRMADDRMYAALQTVRSLTGYARNLSTNCSTSSTSSSVPVSQQNQTNRPITSSDSAAGTTSSTPRNPICIMLCALQDMMLHDVCAPLAMSALRSQARAIMVKRWAPFLCIEGSDSDVPRNTPLTIRYWLSHRKPALIRITEFRVGRDSLKVSQGDLAYHRPSNDERQKNGVLQPNGELEHKPSCFSVVHEPPLPAASKSIASPPGIQPGKLNLESLLLYAIRSRVRCRLDSLANALCLRQRALRLNPDCLTISRYFDRNMEIDQPTSSQEHALLVRFSQSGQVGMEIRVLPLTGAIRIRAYGAAAVAPSLRGPKLSSEVWPSARQFASAAEEIESVVAAFGSVRSRVKFNAAARSLSALDIGVSCTLPPGTASVAATASPEKPASQLVPPFAPLERRAPRRFLTLSPPPPSKDIFASLQSGGLGGKLRLSSSRSTDRSGPSKRSRLTYATTSDALVFIQESSFAGEDWHVGPRPDETKNGSTTTRSTNETDSIDRYSCTAAAAAAWAVTRDIVERRLRRDSLLRAFVQTGVASAAQMHHMKSSEGGDLHLDSASRVLLKVKCEPLPVRRAELLLRGYDAWQVRLSLLPSIFDSTDPYQNDIISPWKQGKNGGNLWSVGVSCTGSQLTFTYPSANTDTVRSFFRDLTRARTAAALARGVPPSRFYRVLRRSPVRIVVGIGPFMNSPTKGECTKTDNNDRQDSRKPLYVATVEYVYSKGNSGGFSLSFSPSKKTMEELVPLIEEALDASGGQVGGILAGLLERACPVAAAAESALRERGSGKIRFVTALRVRAVFVGVQKMTIRGNGQVGSGGSGHGKMQTEQVLHAVDVDARGGSGLVTVIDVGRATAVMIQQGLAHPSSTAGGIGTHRRTDYVSVPRWDEIVAKLPRDGHAEAQRAGSTIVLRMEMLEKFLSDLVTSASQVDASPVNQP